jgi:hypothetical protein
VADEYVTDPELLRQLNAPKPPAEGGYVTDPALLEQLNAGTRAEVSPKKHGAALDWSEVPVEAVKNIPSSALQFGKSVVQPFIHPIDTATSLGELGGGVLQHLGLMKGEEYKPAANAVGKFLMDRYGSIDAIKETLANDPVGLAGDLSMILSGGGTAAARLPGIAGKIGEVASAAGRYTNPLTPLTTAAAPIARGVGRAASEALGVTTGAGGEAIRQAAGAGYKGGRAAEAFRENITGLAPTDEAVNDAQRVLGNMRQQRGNVYRSGMVGVANDPTVLNFNKIDNALANITQVGTFHGQVITPKTQAIRQEIGQAVGDWKRLNPTVYHTAEGLDALKQKIGDIRDATQYGTQDRMIANQAYHAIRQTIIDQVPGYAKVMKGYEQASEQMRILQHELSIPNPKSGNVDTSLRKLQSALRNNVNANFGRRQELVDFLVKNGAPELMYKLAGQALQTPVPRGLSKYTLSISEALLGMLGLTGHAPFLTAALPAAVAGAAVASPRLVGETAYWGGVGARRAAPFVPPRGAFPPAAAIGRVENAEQPAPRQAGGGVPAIGGTGGRSPGTTTPAGARAARSRAGQALQDGGATRDQAGPTIKPGTREHFAALLSRPVHAGSDITGGAGGASRARKAPTAPSYNDIVETLRRRGITGESAGDFGSYSPEAYQEGGEVEDKAGGFEEAAARVRRRYPVREPDPLTQAASKLTWEQWAGEPRAEAMNVLKGEDFRPDVFVKQALGTVGAPAVGPAMRGPVLGAGAVRKAASEAATAKAAPFPQYAEHYPPVGPPAEMPKEGGGTFLGKQLTPEAEEFTKTRSRIMGEMKEEGYKPYFDPAKRSYVDPANYPPSNVDTLTLMPTREKTIGEYREFTDAPETRRLLERAYKAGSKLGNAHDWYAMAQFEKEYIKELGEEAGRKAFLDEFAVPMAATTSGNAPPANFLMAQYLEYARKQGLPLPTKSWELPVTVGGRYGATNLRDYAKMRELGGYQGLGADTPKMHNFARSFLGDLSRAVMDEQMASGALAHAPAGFAERARKQAFGLLEAPVHAMARRLGLQPGNVQDVAWAGFKGGSEGPMIQVINDAIERTHRLTGMPREEIVRRGLIRKEIPIYGGGPLPLPWDGRSTPNDQGRPPQ